MRTTEDLGLMRQRPTNLLANSLCGQGEQAWNALAEIGRQLQILARAQTGEGVFCASNSSPQVYAAARLTVVELVNLFLLTKAKAGKSERYIRAMRYTLKKFVEGRANRYADEITTADIEDWMTALGFAARTQRGHRDDVRTMYNFAIRRGLVRCNPAAGVELPEEEQEAVQIHPPATVRRVLEFARSYDPDICRSLALRYFSGVRTIEAERMTDNLIGEKYIEITREVAKGARARRRRLITIHPNLKAWLALGGVLPAPPQNGRKMLEFQRALIASGMEWPHNVTRHSFCSYHLAKFQNIGNLISESGHSEEMLFGHYREVVTPELAEDYWSIIPG